MGSPLSPVLADLYMELFEMQPRNDPPCGIDNFDNFGLMDASLWKTSSPTSTTSDRALSSPWRQRMMEDYPSWMCWYTEKTQI
jgi:hypothetical protein